MKTLSLTALLSILIAFAAALAQTTYASEDEQEPLESTQLAQHLGSEKESPFELDPVEVTNGSLTFEEELTLRIVRQAFNEVPSNKRKDKDKWLCWTEKPVGSRISRLGCARNGDVWAMRPDNSAVGELSTRKSPQAAVGYGQIMVASRPVSEGRLKKILASLPGNAAYDREFIDMALAGKKKPPRGVPAEEEMDQFAKAWLKVDRLHKKGKSEDIQIAAINDENLSLQRYNQIAELTETYASIKSDIAARVKRLR